MKCLFELPLKSGLFAEVGVSDIHILLAPKACCWYYKRRTINSDVYSARKCPGFSYLCYFSFVSVPKSEAIVMFLLLMWTMYSLSITLLVCCTSWAYTWFHVCSSTHIRGKLPTALCLPDSVSHHMFLKNTPTAGHVPTCYENWNSIKQCNSCLNIVKILPVGEMS